MKGVMENTTKSEGVTGDEIKPGYGMRPKAVKRV